MAFGSWSRWAHLGGVDQVAGVAGLRKGGAVAGRDGPAQRLRDALVQRARAVQRRLRAACVQPEGGMRVYMVILTFIGGLGYVKFMLNFYDEEFGLCQQTSQSARGLTLRHCPVG